MSRSMSPRVAKIERRVVPDLIADKLMTAISDGTFQPGDQLPSEPDLARQIGVGRSSLRSAIQRLRMLGILEVRSGLGTFVVEQGRSDPILAFAAWAGENEFETIELFESRLAIETTAGGLAAERATRREVARLRASARAHVAANKSGDIDALVRTDEEFHIGMVECSRNSLLARLYTMLAPELTPYRTVSLALPGSADRSGAHHLAIVDAVEARDPAAARNAVVDHLWVLYSEVTRAAGVSGTAARVVASPAVWRA